MAKCRCAVLARVAARADVADDVTALDGLPLAQSVGVPIEVRVVVRVRRRRIEVVDRDAAGDAHEELGDGAVVDRHDRRPCRRGQVDAFVRSQAARVVEGVVEIFARDAEDGNGELARPEAFDVLRRHQRRRRAALCAVRRGCRRSGGPRVAARRHAVVATARPVAHAQAARRDAHGHLVSTAGVPSRTCCPSLIASQFVSADAAVRLRARDLPGLRRAVDAVVLLREVDPDDADGIVRAGLDRRLACAGLASQKSRGL